jgi:hypothetical protein
MGMKVRSLRIAGLMALGLGLLGAVCVAHNSNAQEPAPTVELSGKKFKNIKVLKDLPADKLIPVMHEYNTALNVKCSFCHDTTVGPDGKRTGYEKDTNKVKNQAREMILMTVKLNKSFKAVDKQATCFMCHHGHPEPETHAPEPK